MPKMEGMMLIMARIITGESSIHDKNVYLAETIFVGSLMGTENRIYVQDANFYFGFNWMNPWL